MAAHGEEVADALAMEYERLISASPTATRPSQSSVIRSVPASGTEDASWTYPKILTLDVGGRRFKVSIDILVAESRFFQYQFSDRFNWRPEPDGSYFLDADPELFDHLIRFMRRSSTFPLFYTKDQGFDYNLYQRLQTKAEYFQIDKLHDWIKEKNYLNVVTIRTYKPRRRELDHIEQENISCNMNEDWHFVPRVRKTYVCPRKIIMEIEMGVDGHVASTRATMIPSMMKRTISKWSVCRKRSYSMIGSVS
jgi:hypothetical protein